MRMLLLAWLAHLVGGVMNRRRNRWIEISVTRAWSYDINPRLFDLSDN